MADELKIGAYICNGCGLGDRLDSSQLEMTATRDGKAKYAKSHDFLCSADGVAMIQKDIDDGEANQIVIAACSPRTHEGLFQETLINAGLNKYLLEMANIRNQDSWVHSDNPQEATAKARDLVQMAVARAESLHPLREKVIPVNERALVVGGGVAGMNAA